MDKRLFFHILICALLFAAITIPYFTLASEDAIPFEAANNSLKASGGVTEDGEVIMIGDEIDITFRPDSVYPGENTWIALRGTPNTLYDINVYYPSGISSAKAFSDKYSDSDGRISWDFKVSSKTTADKLRVVIRSERTYVSFYILVTDL